MRKESLLFSFKHVNISHLDFTDDILIAIRATHKSHRHLSNVLNVYSASIDLNINKNKWIVYFPENCPAETQHKVSNFLNFLKEPGRFHTLDTFLPHNSRISINIQIQIIDKYLNKINGWQKHLSQAEGATSVNSMLNSIPLHSIVSYWSTVKFANSISKYNYCYFPLVHLQV